MGNDGETVLAMLESLNSKFDDLDLKFELLDTKFEALDNKYEASDSRFEMFDERFEMLNNGVLTVENSISSVDGRFEQLEQKTEDIHTVCSNEISSSMQTIADAFQNMNQKLDEVVKVKAENEILKMRIEQLENEVRKIKAHLNII
ncbi:MAG: hypothetical protein J6A75_08110 [Lachnospiraceae bacterium]|nr:hypothetical protein [Lachnospiraceae bacterium]